MNRDITSPQCQCGDPLVGTDEFFRSRALTRKNITKGMQQMSLCRHLITWDTAMRMTEHVFQSYFFHMDLKTFPPPLQDEILIMEIWKAGNLGDAQFLPEAATISFRVRPIRGREGLLSFWPRAQRNGRPQFKPQEAYRTLLILFSLHKDSSLPARLAAKKF